MRTWIKVFLIISAALISTGILSLCLTVAFGGVNLVDRNNIGSFSEITSTFDDISYITISDEYNDVIVRKGESDYVKVVRTETEKTKYDISFSASGALKIIFVNHQKWFDYIFFGSIKSHKLIVELPEKDFEYISVKTNSGNINAQELSSKETFLKSDSGKVDVSGNVGELTVKTTSGEIEVSSKLKASKAAVSATSGDLMISGEFSDTVDIHTTSGDIRLGLIFGDDVVVHSTSGEVKSDVGLSLRNIDIDTTSGDVELKDIRCSETCKIKTNSGDIDLERFDAKDYNLKSTSGDIEAEILAPKLYNIDTTSGRIRVPKNETVQGINGVFEAKTISGNVNVEVVDK